MLRHRAPSYGRSVPRAWIQLSICAMFFLPQFRLDTHTCMSLFSSLTLWSCWMGNSWLSRNPGMSKFWTLLCEVCWCLLCRRRASWKYLDVGTWYLAFYNDGRKMEQVMVYSTPIGERPTIIRFFLHLNAFLFNISKLITSWLCFWLYKRLLAYTKSMCTSEWFNCIVSVFRNNRWLLH